MRKGFQLLETRLINESINISDIEKRNDIQFPPLYKLFLETFKLPLLDSSFIAYFPNEEVGFDDFHNDIEKNIEVYKLEETYYKFSMLPIISSGIHAGGVCVCIKGKNKDKIYVDNEMFEGRFQLVSNNIFEFMRGIIEVEDGDDISIYL